MDRYYQVAVTGHRPPKIGGYNPKHPMREAVRNALFDIMNFYINSYGPPAKAYSGFAQGVDQDFAEICMFYGVPVIAALPVPDQDKLWPDKAKIMYKKLLERTDKVVPVYENLPHNTSYAECMKFRNKWVIDQLKNRVIGMNDILISVWDGSPSGTMHCVNYAKNSGITNFNIDPMNLMMC